MYNSQLDQAQKAMRVLAEEYKLEHGFGCAWFEPYRQDQPPEVRTITIGRFFRDPNPKKKGDEGTSYVGIAFAKFAYSKRTGMPSGHPKKPKLRKGESGYRGCIILTVLGGIIWFFFSGGTEDQDVDIAEAGQRAFLA